MEHRFEELAPPAALDPLRRCLVHKNTYLKADSILVFVCGAKPNGGAGARDRLIQYGKKHMRSFQFFRAEDVFRALIGASKRDLLSIETSLADLSDCIIIILESEGAFAELGAFTVRDDLAHIVLAINDMQHRNGGSFLSLGPLAKLENRSKFRPVVYGNLKSILSLIPEIEQRLSKIRRTNDKCIDMSTSAAFHDRSPKHRALFIHDLLRIFAPLQKRDLISLLNTLFGTSSTDITIEVGLLEALQLAARTKTSYLIPTTPPGDLFFEYHDFNAAKCRSAALNHYHKYWPLRCRELVYYIRGSAS